jgi:drug/metabolite transporter (DMT)-like permease
VLSAAGIWGSMQFTYLAIDNTTTGNAVLAPLLLGERIGIWHVVGTLFVLAGVGLTTRV